MSAPSCGGGGLHAGHLAPAAAPAGAVFVLAALALLGTVRRRPEAVPYAGRLADGGLFRPPRLAG